MAHNTSAYYWAAGVVLLIVLIVCVIAFTRPADKQAVVHTVTDKFTVSDMSVITRETGRSPVRGQGKIYGGGSAEFADLMPEIDPNQMSYGGQADVNRATTAQYELMQDLSVAGSWGDVTQLQSLEPDVFKQQAQYTNDLGIANTGPSTMVVRSDPNDINPWVGFRRTDYTGVWPGATSRVVATETADQMDHQTKFMLY